MQKKENYHWIRYLVALTLVLLFTTSFALAAEVFDSEAAEEEGYWYSRYNMGTLAMISGLGEVFMPDMDMMMMAMRMADADFDPMQKSTDYGDGNHPMAPVNPSLLQVVYKSGSPYYTQPFDVNDFATQRWDPTTFDRALTGLATGHLMIKEVEWARGFHVDEHFGVVSDDFGAQWRFIGSVLVLECKMQAMYFLKNRSQFDLSDGGDYVMLWALSDLGNVLESDKLLYSESNRYKDPQASKMFLDAADMMFGEIKDKNASSIMEKSLAIQSFVWYAASTNDVVGKAQAIVRIVRIAEELKDMKPMSAAERAYAIRGLIETKRTLGLQINEIAELAGQLFNEFDPSKGIFESQTTYTTDDVAIIVGALNAVRIFESASVDSQRAEEIFTIFFETILNKAGMQQSAPPIPVSKDKFEYEGEPEIFFRYPDMPFPPMAGGDYGIAPVFASSVTYRDGKWKIDRTFDSAGAMHASNEMIWLHHDEVDGFPEIFEYK